MSTPAVMDMTEFLDVFLDEGREQLSLLESNILAMERGDHSLDILQVIFRAAHTLKGSSRAMGFLAVGDLTHEMENILDDLRHGTLSVDTPIINALLDCLDALGALVDTVADTGTDTGVTGKDIPALVARLAALRTGAVPAAPAAAGTMAAPPAEALTLSDFEATSAADAREAGLDLLRLEITLSADCLMKSVRVFMVLAALEPLGSVLASRPGEEALDDEDFDLAFTLLLATDRPASDIQAALNTISELETIAVTPWAASDSAPIDSAPMDAAPIDSAPVVPVLEPAEAPMAEAPAAAAPAKAAQSQTIRVEVSRLDSLLNLVGELVIDRSQILQYGQTLHSRYPQEEAVAQLLETAHRIGRVTGELQDQIMKARMLPVDGVFQRMPRMVRDLAQKTGKEVDFRLSGGETELDRSVLETLGDPLIHLLRNSVDHGIETPEVRTAAGKPAQGIVTLSARHEENQIVIEITDDGGGIDPVKIKAASIKKGLLSQADADRMTEKDALNLIFASGFSTAQTLSDISGRGVGMDIVKSNLEKMGGRVLVDSVVGAGSRFTIHLPLTLAIIRALLVTVDGGTYVVPLGSVVEMLRLGTRPGELSPVSVGGQAAISLRERTIPILSLSHLLQGDCSAAAAENVRPDAYVVVVGLGETQIGLCVDALIGEQEVVIKSLGMLLGDTPGLSGATILGDGRVALIVDTAKAFEILRQTSTI